MNLLLTFLVILAITARASRLLVDDLITQPLRDKIAYAAFTYDDSGEPTIWQKTILKFLHELLACQWCVSIWIGAVATAAAWASLDVTAGAMVWIAMAAGASYGTGMLAAAVDKLYAD